MALYVYNSNPAAVCPNSSLVLEGLAREDLFTVVHEQVQTDTADYADLLLPATTSMEHLDVYRSFGHLYLQLAEPVIAPREEARTNWEVFGQLARAMGMPRPPLRDAAPGADRRPSPGRGPGRRRDHPRAPPRRALGADRRAAALPALRGRGADAFGARGVLLGDPPRGRACRRCPRTSRSGRAGTTRPSGRATPSAATSRRTASSSTRRSASRRCSGRGRAVRRCSFTRTTRRPGRSPGETSSPSSTTGAGRSSPRSCPTTRCPARWSSRGSGGTSSCREGGASTS